MERFQRLELSKGYVELLKEAEELRYACTDVLFDWTRKADNDEIARKPWPRYPPSLVMR